MPPGWRPTGGIGNPRDEKSLGDLDGTTGRRNQAASFGGHLQRQRNSRAIRNITGDNFGSIHRRRALITKVAG